MTEESPFNVVDERVFAKSLRAPAVKADQPTPCRPSLELVCGISFDVTRDVVRDDRKICRVTEHMHTISWRKLLYRDAKTLGVFYVYDN